MKRINIGLGRKTTTITVLAAVVGVCVAATSNQKPPAPAPSTISNTLPGFARNSRHDTRAVDSGDEKPYSNLKVLPKDIAPKDLQRIMIDDFEDGLGVSCNFCHARDKDSVHFDFASDAKPEKEITRAMMRMELSVNKKFFRIKHPLIGDPVLVVTCNTCHRGTAFPDGL